MAYRTYHTLISREDETSPWCIEYGAWHLEDAKSEMQDYRDHGHKAKNLKIVKTGSASTRTINAAIAAL